MQAVVDRFCLALSEVNRLERRPVLSAIAFVLARLEPAAATDIERLAAEAEKRGLVRLVQAGGDVIVRDLRPASERPAAPCPPALPAARYREFVRDKLRCPLPGAALRGRVYAGTQSALDAREAPEEPVALLDLACRVEAALRGEVGQRTVFKLLFALVLAGAFRIVRHDRPHAIRILSAREPPAAWDRLFLRACLLGLRRDRPDWPLDAAALAEALDATPSMLRPLIESLQNPNRALTPPPHAVRGC